MSGYAKLHSNIVTSSLWSLSSDTRVLFITMLAMADANGFVEAALPGLTRIANLTPKQMAKALAELEAPDEHSKCREHDGRRVLRVERGWQIVTYLAHRAARDPEVRREQNREAKRAQRLRERAGNHGQHPSASVSTGQQHQPGSAQAEAEAEAEAISPIAPDGGHDALLAPTSRTPPTQALPGHGPVLTGRDLRLLPQASRLRVSKDELPDLDALVKLYGWDPCVTVITELAQRSTKGPVWLSAFRERLADRFALEPADYRRAGLPVPAGVSHGA